MSFATFYFPPTSMNPKPIVSLNYYMAWPYIGPYKVKFPNITNAGLKKLTK